MRTEKKAEKRKQQQSRLSLNKQTICTLVLGISGKSQILFAVVYLSRYLDLFTTFISVYNTFMKFVFVVSSLGTLYLMYLKFRATYDHNHDSFRIEFLLVPCVILALLINHDFTVLEVSVAWCRSWTSKFMLFQLPLTGIMDILNLLGVGRDLASALPGQQDGRGRKYYEPLSIRAGLVPSSLHPQLGEFGVDGNLWLRLSRIILGYFFDVKFIFRWRFAGFEFRWTSELIVDGVSLLLAC